jgi:hypothetical protein
MNRRWLVVGAAALVFLALGTSIRAAEEKGPKKDAVIKEAASEPGEAGKAVVLTGPAVFKLDLDEVPAFDREGYKEAYLVGQYVQCSTQPSKQVKRYPKLNSKKPLYGSVVFDGSLVDPSAGTVFHFVLDESGGAGRAKSEKDEAAKSSALLSTLAKALTGEKTEPPPPKPPEPILYDRLYFDVNRDLDLTNDRVLQPAKGPPLRPSPYKGPTFENLVVPMDFGPGLGKRPVRLIPRLIVLGPDRAYVDFVLTAGRKGKIRIGKNDYTVSLDQRQMISGRFDRPLVDLDIRPTSGPAPSRRSFSSIWLCAMREFDGRLYTFSATPLGDELTVKPYEGYYGVLRVGPGGRPITRLGMLGELVSKDSLVSAGSITTLPPPEEYPREHRLPVGDYTPVRVGMDYGRLKVSIQALGFALREPAEEGETRPPAVYAIRIRKDTPFVLELSGKPAVVFTGPRKSRTFKPGEEVRIEAVLTEPSLGVMIAGLWDASRKRGEIKIRDGGKEIALPDYERLDPALVIRDASGKQVAEGKMPFG